MDKITSGYKRKRKYPGVPIRLRPDMHDIRRREALERLETFSALTIEQKIAVLDVRLGKDVGARRQRARYAAKLEKSRREKEVSSRPSPVVNKRGAKK